MLKRFKNLFKKKKTIIVIQRSEISEEDAQRFVNDTGARILRVSDVNNVRIEYV